MTSHVASSSTDGLATRSSGLSSGLTLIFAVAVGIVVSSLYASQPIVAPVGASLGLSSSASGLVTTLTLIGYAVGLFMLVPLADISENRRLIVRTLSINALSLAAAGLAPVAPVFLVASFATGLTASAIQMLVPIAAGMAPEASRGRVVGRIMSGLMLGILLSRPAAGLSAEFFGWRAFYLGLALLVALLALTLHLILPRRQPTASTGYVSLLRSLWSILESEGVLRRRATYQTLCMAAFGLFWTAIALRLSQPPFDMGQPGIALFSLAGATGAVVAPIAGWAGDKGWSKAATRLAHLAVPLALLLACVAGIPDVGKDGALPHALRLPTMVLAAVLLDLGVIGDQTIGRRAVNMLSAASRARVNGLYTGLFFLGGAIGAALSGIAWVHAGWTGVCLAGAAFGVCALALSLAERPT